MVQMLGGDFSSKLSLQHMLHVCFACFTHSSMIYLLQEIYVKLFRTLSSKILKPLLKSNEKRIGETLCLGSLAERKSVTKRLLKDIYF